jgi:flagellar hook assembly protein FlgD
MQNQSGYQEQYAEIDLGNTTTERATQDMGKSGDFKLKPIIDQYEFMSNTLESLLKGEQIQDLTPPAQLVVNQNFPNPFSSTTTINVSVPKDGDVELTIYNIKGQRIYSSVAKFASKGSQDLSWNGKDYKGRTVGNGIYFYKVTQNNQSVVKKCIMIK